MHLDSMNFRRKLEMQHTTSLVLCFGVSSATRPLGAAYKYWRCLPGEVNCPVWRIIRLRGKQSGINLHPHMLRHSFVDNWLRNGGTEIDLARLCGWTTTRMASHYAQFRAEERALAAHTVVQPLDRLKQTKDSAWTQTQLSLQTRDLLLLNDEKPPNNNYWMGFNNNIFKFLLSFPRISETPEQLSQRQTATRRQRERGYQCQTLLAMPRNTKI